MKGTFRARAKQWELGESSTGKEQIGVLFDILTEGAEFSQVSWYGYFTEGAIARTIESMRHMGWKGEDLEHLEDLGANEVELVVDEEEYEGKLYTKVKWVNRVGGLAMKAPLAGEKKKAFAAAMKTKIRAIDAAAGVRKPAQANGQKASPAQSGPPEPPPLNDADLPF